MDREKAMDCIVKRCDDIKNDKYFPPIIIFPEGATTNGTSVIEFKRGAFATLRPVKIFCLKYGTNSNFTPHWDPVLSQL